MDTTAPAAEPAAAPAAPGASTAAHAAEPAAEPRAPGASDAVRDAADAAARRCAAGVPPGGLRGRLVQLKRVASEKNTLASNVTTESNFGMG